MAGGRGGAREKVVAVRKQVGRVLAVVVVVGAVVSGCGGPGQAGAAVIVGSDAVPLERVQSQLESVLARSELVAEITAQGGEPADIARDIVTRAVLHDLVQRQGAAAGMVVTDIAVDAEIAERGGADALLATTLTDPAGLRDRVRDELVAAQLAQRSVAGLSVTADLLATTSRAEAERRAQVLSVGGPGADALFDVDPQASQRGTVYTAATNPDIAGTVLFGTPVGGTVAFQPDSRQSTWIVFRVTERRTDTPSGPQVVSQLSKDQLIAIGERMLQPVAEELGIRVNPRYGVWDPIRLRVVDGDQTAGTILPPVPAAG